MGRVNYGFPYMGSKSKIAESNSTRKSIQTTILDGYGVLVIMG